MIEITNKITEKFYSFSDSKVIKISLLKQSGSYRKYYRIITEKGSLLGVYNYDRAENDAFISFSKHFYAQKFNVPKIIAEFLNDNIYFIEDLGDITLFDFLQKNNDDEKTLSTYKKILDELINLQFRGIKNLDLSKAYPRAEFDKQSIMWDLNYFKYFVLKIAKVPFNEQNLEQDFNKFADILTTVDNNFFLFRDFQSRNIMLKDDKVYFIDYQGGRKGAFYYDLASLLYDSKANLSENMRNILLDYYFEILNKKHKISKDKFTENFKKYVLVRILQAFGAYGFRGLVEHKIGFIKSIPKAIKNIKTLLNDKILLEELSELKKSLNFLVYKSELAEKFETKTSVDVSINSFSYRKTSYPTDKTGNGGGFVFDCRFLPNPYYITELKEYTGLSMKITEYLDAFDEVQTFVSQSVEIIRKAVNNYDKAGYTNLQVNFGCTGGRHRSVYCAEKTCNLLKELYNINAKIEHLVIGNRTKI